MRGWIILLLPFTAVGIATANTIGLLTGPSCSSGSGLVISVTQQGKVAGGVRVDVYREIENGEKPYWSGATEGKGTATPSALLPGQYRVFADVGGRSATLDIVAGDFRSAPATCELKIDPLFKTKSRAVWQEKPFRLHLKQLRGIVEAQKGAPIPYVIVKVLRWSSSPRDVALFQTDSKGQFDLALNDGPYIALFTYQGFCLRALAFQVGSDGWLGFELGMTPGSSDAEDLPAKEWTAKALLRTKQKKGKI